MQPHYAQFAMLVRAAHCARQDWLLLVYRLLSQDYHEDKDECATSRSNEGFAADTIFADPSQSVDPRQLMQCSD